MTAVRLVCHRCSQIRQVPLDTVLLLICTDDPAMSGYRFPCSECGERQQSAGNLVAVALNDLVASGVRVLRWSKCNLPSIPPSVQALPPLTLDDVITAHFTLPSELDVLLGRAA